MRSFLIRFRDCNNDNHEFNIRYRYDIHHLHQQEYFLNIVCIDHCLL